MNYAIEAEDLVKTFCDVKALDHVTLHVQEGEIFGFLGPNGAGKSTFVKIMLNLIFPSAGTASIFGINVNNISSRKNLGFLPENIFAHQFLSVEEFIRFHAELSGIKGTGIKEEINRCIDALGIGDIRKKRIGALSKGMLQKVGIAQAILGRPRLVFLDEPTSGLDPIAIKELRNLLIEMKGSGTTIFLNSHLLSEVERTCDRVTILNKGKIIKTGTQSDISEKGKHLEIAVDSFTDAMVMEINKLSMKPVEIYGNIMKAYPERESDSVAVHRIIVDKGGKLLSLSWKGESLEELFYRLVKHENTCNS
jgi:ABC-2 type transport system ATP-binding protein